jgi:tetratricopeptide (TPR) repeat protein
MKFKLSLHTLLALATCVSLAQSPIASAKPKAKPVKPSSNMVFPASGTKVKTVSNIERAKELLFKEGDYAQARQYLNGALQTEPNEPLTYAMNTLYPFSLGDFEKVREYGNKTIETAEKLTKTNPLRGNLYQGVGLAIIAAYEIKRENGGALGALSKLQKVFEYMDKAKKIDPNNPELNLVKGYMDLLLAVNVPFSDTTQAIEQLQNAEPRYLALRGMYIGYRDLKQYDKAIVAIDAAIQIAPNNPELTYYKAQLLAIRGRDNKNEADLKKSIQLFETAYEKRSQLLLSTIAQILSERCQAKSALAKQSNDACWAFESELKKNNPNVVVGLTNLPLLN